MSSFGSTGAPAIQGLDPSPGPMDSTKSALALSPSSMQPFGSIDASLQGMNTDWNQISQQNAFVPRNESRVSVSTAADEEEGNTLSRTESLSQSLTLDDGPAAQSAEQHRRRSSGVWTNAFSGMSLQDGQLSTVPPLVGSLSDPFSASQIANEAQAQAQAQFQALQADMTLPAVPENYTTDEMAMPSMSDVKDLWKLFMNDPLSGFTPAGEKGNAMEIGMGMNASTGAAGSNVGIGMPLATPRPAVAERTLSKSNSVPDLTSPFLGQAFFANYFNNAVTPRPGDGPANGLEMTLGQAGQSRGQGRKDGIPAAALAAMQDSNQVVQPDEVIEPDANAGQHQQEQHDQNGEQAKTIDKWKTALSSRPVDFQLNNPKVGIKSVSPPANVSMNPSTTALNLHIPEAHNRHLNRSMNLYPGMASTGMGGGMRFDLSGRPSASVLQPRNGLAGMALNQTLAPERAPSFMYTPGINAGPSGGLGTNMANPSGIQVTPPKGGRNPIAVAAQMHAAAAYPPPPMFAFAPPKTVHPASSAQGLQSQVNSTMPMLSMQAQGLAHAPAQVSAAAAALATVAAQSTAAAAALGGPASVRPPQTHKGSSATTRPGNKRLASQVLGGDGKKATFGLWDDEETDVEYVQ